MHVEAIATLIQPPLRVVAPELLDGEVTDFAALAENLRDLRHVDTLLGISRLMWRRVAPLLPAVHATLLDVASGGCHGALRLSRLALRSGRALTTIASDRLPDALRLGSGLRGGFDALALPLADGAVDVATCALALHHFEPPAAAALLRELRRVARRGAVLVDLRRSWAGIGGALLLARGPWGAMASHDGPVSARRAYTVAEVRAIVADAGVAADVRGDGPLLLSVVCRA